MFLKSQRVGRTGRHAFLAFSTAVWLLIPHQYAIASGCDPLDEEGLHAARIRAAKFWGGSDLNPDFSERLLENYVARVLEQMKNEKLIDQKQADAAFSSFKENGVLTENVVFEEADGTERTYEVNRNLRFNARIRVMDTRYADINKLRGEDASSSKREEQGFYDTENEQIYISNDTAMDQQGATGVHIHESLHGVAGDIVEALLGSGSVERLENDEFDLEALDHAAMAGMCLKDNMSAADRVYAKTLSICLFDQTDRCERRIDGLKVKVKRQKSAVAKVLTSGIRPRPFTIADEKKIPEKNKKWAPCKPSKIVSVSISLDKKEKHPIDYDV